MSTAAERIGSHAVRRRGGRSRAVWRRVLKRPEIGALGGVILVFAFFTIMAPPFRQLPAFTTVLYQASILGIPAVAVALLMVGGEFDLSAGRRGDDGVAVRLDVRNRDRRQYLGGGRVCLAAVALHRRAQRLSADLDAAAELPGDALDVPDAAMGWNIAVTKLVTGNVATQDISGGTGL